MGKQQTVLWQPHEVEKLKTVALPPKIKCGRCDKNKMLTQYSDNQKNKVRWQILKNVRTPEAPVCNKCSDQRIDELKCIDCNKWKGIEEYALSRRKPDDAQCYVCTDRQVTQRPVNHETYEDPNRAFVTPDSSGGVMPDYWSHHSDASSTTDWETYNDTNSETGGGAALTDTFSDLSVTGSRSDASLIDTEGMFPSQTNDSGRSRATSSWRTGSTGPVSVGRSISYRTPVSEAGSEHTYASSMVENSVSHQVGRSGWAKIRAAVPDGPVGYGRADRGPPMRPDGDAQREVEDDVDSAWANDSDSDDDDDGERGGDDSDDDSDGENTVI